jgi:cyclophilin family peptidyl-prolyl cis-trans isomerase
MKRFLTVLLGLSLITLISCKKEEIEKAQSQAPTATQEQPDVRKIMEKPVVVIDTDLGQIEIELFPKDAPKTTLNFVSKTLAKEFDGTTFHRLVPGFVIQGGDPLSKDADPANDGYGGEQMEAEPRKKSNLRGTISMASSSRTQPIDSQSDAQFFINLDDKCARLDQMGFIPFGKVVKGMEVVDAIAKQPRDMRDRPLKNITIKGISIKQ